jgi:cytohesin
VLGRGALATVYAATDVHAREPVAVKVVSMFGESAAALRAILPEYRSVRRLEDGRRHVLHVDRPRVCKDKGFDLVLLPMERADQSFRDWLTETKQAAGIKERLEEGLALLRQAARGVAALHQAGIAHLDLKPGNLLLLEKAAASGETAASGEAAATEAAATDWTVKVADFGLARSLRAGEDLNPDVIADGVGTPHYMAPEQIFAARQKDVGPKADVYSLGVMLFELLDGDCPFDGGAEAVRRKHREVDPPAIATAVPQALKDLARACLRKDPAARPSVKTVIMGLVPASKAERAAFEQAQNDGTLPAWRSFHQHYPNGWFGKSAQEHITAIEKQEERLVQAVKEAVERQDSTDAKEQLNHLCDLLGRHEKPPAPIVDPLKKDLEDLEEWKRQRSTQITRAKEALDTAGTAPNVTSENLDLIRDALSKLQAHVSERSNPKSDEAIQRLRTRLQSLKVRHTQERWEAKYGHIVQAAKAAVDGVNPSARPGSSYIEDAEEKLARLQDHIENVPNTVEVPPEAVNRHDRLRHALDDKKQKHDEYLEKRRSERREAATTAIDEYRFDEAEEQINKLRTLVGSEEARVQPLVQRLAEARAERLKTLQEKQRARIEAVEAALAEENPEQAKDRLDAVRSNRTEEVGPPPEQIAALEGGVERLETTLQAQEALEAATADEQRLSDAEEKINQLRELAGPEDATVQQLARGIEQIRAKHVAARKQEQRARVDAVEQALEDEDHQRAKGAFEKLLENRTDEIGPASREVARLRERIKSLQEVLQSRAALEAANKALAAAKAAYKSGTLDDASEHLDATERHIAGINDSDVDTSLVQEAASVRQHLTAMQDGVQAIRTSINVGDIEKAFKTLRKLEQEAGVEHATVADLRETVEGAKRDRARDKVKRAFKRGNTNLIEEALASDKKALFQNALIGVLREMDLEDRELLLCEAASKGHLTLMKQLLIAGADPDALEVAATSPLHEATAASRPEAIRLLLGAKASLDVRDDQGQTPLHLAITEDSATTLKLASILLNAWADPNVKDDRGRTPLHEAVEEEAVNIVPHLVDKDADPNIFDAEGEAPLHLATRSGSRKMVAALLDAEADPDIVSKRKQTPLLIAVNDGAQDIAEILLEAGAKPDHRVGGQTPLHCAVQQGNAQILNELLRVDPALDVLNDEGEAPLHLTVRNGSREMTAALLDADADPDVTDETGNTPLHEAAAQGCEKLARLMIEGEADPNRKNHLGRTPSHIAVSKGHLKALAVLLEAGADPNAQTESGACPLHTAAARGHSEATRILLNADARVDQQDKPGATPLHWAANNGHAGVAEVLLGADANPNAQGEAGQTPLHEAAADGHETLVRELLAADANTDLRDNDGRTCLYMAVQRGHVGNVKTLISSGMDPDGALGKGWTPLTKAAERGHPEVVKLLLDMGADPDKPSSSGDMPIDLGVNYLEVVKLLLGAGANATEKVGEALCRAVADRELNVVETLLKNGADPDAPDMKGTRPLDRALLWDDKRIAIALLKAGADPNRPDEKGNTPLQRAILKEEVDAVEALLEAGADPNVADDQGWRPIRIAMDQDRAITMVKLLLEEGADPNVAYDPSSGHPNEETPLDIAKRRKNKDFEIVEVLIPPPGVYENQMTLLLKRYGGKEAKEFRGVAEKVADTLREWLGHIGRAGKKAASSSGNFLFDLGYIVFGFLLAAAIEYWNISISIIISLLLYLFGFLPLNQIIPAIIILSIPFSLARAEG